MEIRGTIGIAMTDHFVIPFHFAYSLINLIRYCDKAWGSGSVELEFAEGALLEENRIGLLGTAEEGWLLMIDTDMVFPPNAAELLDNHMSSFDLITGLYFTGYDPVKPAIYTPETSDRTPAVRYEDYSKDSVFEIGGCGMGFCMIGPKIIADFRRTGQIKESFRRMNKFGKHVGEDLSFCYRVRNMGYQMYCDSKLKLGHLRPYSLSESQGYVSV